MNQLASEKYIRLTSFTQDGRPKHTPVWVARLSDDVLGTTTDDDSWKVKRLRNTPKVELCASDSRGKVADGIEPSHGTARILDAADSDYAKLESALINKYGIQYRLFRFIRQVRRTKPCGIAITLD